jgi:hypothetical protein
VGHGEGDDGARNKWMGSERRKGRQRARQIDKEGEGGVCGGKRIV